MVSSEPTPGQEPGLASQRHVPVLAARCVELLAPALDQPRSVLIDCTLGMGGHSAAVLDACPNAVVIGIDRDPQALDIATARLAGFGDRFRAVHAVYDEIAEVVDAVAAAAPGWGRTLAQGTVQGVLMDLGVSSLQLDEAGRGFAYAKDAPLDMRMDPTTGPTAADILNTYAESDLARVLREYGEERFAPRIARRIVARREHQAWARSGELVDLIRSAIPAAARTSGGNPAKRTFQALRIEVNGELDTLRAAVPAAIDVLAVGGRIVVESYQSLEDRIVKRALAAGATSQAPPDLPVEPESDRPYLRLLVRGAEEAPAAERLANPRSASVRLRAAERTRPTPPDRIRERKP